MQYLTERVGRIRSSISGARAALVKERRAEIVAAAARLFRSRGFAQTAIRDIAAEMGVSQGHIYQYISKKEDILLLMLETAADQYAEHLLVIADQPGPAAERLARAISVYYRIIDRHHDKTYVLYSQVSHLELEDRKLFDRVEVDVTLLFKTLLDQGAARGEFEAVDGFLLAFDLVSLGHMWALKHHRFRGRMDIDAYAAAQTGYALKILGAAPEKG